MASVNPAFQLQAVIQRVSQGDWLRPKQGEIQQAGQIQADTVQRGTMQMLCFPVMHQEALPLSVGHLNTDQQQSNPEPPASPLCCLLIDQVTILRQSSSTDFLNFMKSIVARYVSLL